MEQNKEDKSSDKNEGKDFFDEENLYEDVQVEEGNMNNFNEELRESNISRATINSVYGNNYDTILASIKHTEETTKKFFKETTKSLEEKYKAFNKNISEYFMNLTNKFTEAFNLTDDNINVEKSALIQKYSKEYLEQLSKIGNMQNQILESIKETTSILMSALKISENLGKEKPIQHFLEKEFTNIINSWLFIKLDIEKFNFAKTINNSELDENFKGFIYKVCQDKNFIMNIGPSSSVYDDLNQYNLDDLNQNDAIIISDNYQNLTRLKINKVNNADSYFNLVKHFNRLNYLKLNNVTFSSEKRNKMLFKKCPNIETLVMNGIFNLKIELLEFLPNNLTKLILSNNNFVNYDFQNIMKNYIVKSDSLRRNLVLLSFSNNKISKVDLESLVHHPRQSFISLKELDFHKNKICKFSINEDLFLELKIINCCYNKFSKNYFSGNKNILSLLSGNLFLTDIDCCQKYYNSLCKQLNEKIISLTQLSLSYLPNEFCGKFISSIIISDNILLSLKKLDLSYNNLNCDTLFTFINNNKGAIYLKKLNLSGNKLDDNFFKRFLDLKLPNIFTRLQKINLNSNLIGGDCPIETADLGANPSSKESNKMDAYKLRLIYKFIETNKYLTKLYIIKNPICDKSIISKNVKMNDVTQLVLKDESNHIIINCFYSFLLKIIFELLNNKEEKNNRGNFNLKFDIGQEINFNSETYPYKEKFIVFK